MEFFEKLGKKASETYKTAAEKTNKLANDTKLKGKINDCKSKIKDVYKEIGKKVYQKYVLDGDENIKEDITEYLKTITNLTDQIEDYEKQRLELCDKKQCENCKNEMDKAARFCPKCGKEQPEDVIHEAEVLNEENVEENNQPEGENAEQVAEETEHVVEENVEQKNEE